MAYKAIKPVRFDRRYSIGETIPDAVVDPARAPHLQAMGLIQPLPEAEPSPAPQDAQESAPDAAEDNTQGSDKDAAETANAAPEKAARTKTKK